MRETESSLQQFAEYLLREQLAPGHVVPHMVRWVRRFLAREAADEPLADQARRFCDELARSGTAADWQVRQAEQALRLYFVSFLERTDWRLRPPTGLVDKDGLVDPPRAIVEMRRRLRTRHYALRTESAYVDWAARFLAALAKRQASHSPRVDASSVRDYLTHLAVRRRVSASTQNQAFCALLFLCREVLGVEVDGVADAARARRGERLPTVMSVPETAALLAAMQGTPRLMAALIYGGGLRVSECCELRVKDLDFDQGLVCVRNGKGDKDRTTLLADGCRDDLRTQLAASERLHRADRAAGIVRRHHLDQSVVQKAVRAAAVSAGIHKPVSVHTLRHCFATHLLLNGVDIRQIQEYLGHANVETTMVYTHVVRDLRNPPRSPLDMLRETAARAWDGSGRSEVGR